MMSLTVRLSCCGGGKRSAGCYALVRCPTRSQGESLRAVELVCRSKWNCRLQQSPSCHSGCFLHVTLCRLTCLQCVLYTTYIFCFVLSTKIKEESGVSLQRLPVHLNQRDCPIE